MKIRTVLLLLVLSATVGALWLFLPQTQKTAGPINKMNAYPTASLATSLPESHPLLQAFPHALATPSDLPPLTRPLPPLDNVATLNEPLFLGSVGHYESIMALTRLEGERTVTRFYAADQLGLRPKNGYALGELERELETLGYACERPYPEAKLLSLLLTSSQQASITSIRKALRDQFTYLAAVDFYEVFTPLCNRFDSEPIVPNDPIYRHQWNLPAIEAPKAWRFHRGSSEVVVGVLDTGVHLDHPDFAGRLVEGKNFAYLDWLNDPEPYDDRSGHGTAMASAIAANANNDAFISGVTWHCKVMPLKRRHNTYSPYGSEPAGIDYALARDVRIISYSGTAGPYDLFSEAVKDAAEADCLFVAAMGNTGDEITIGGVAADDESIAVGASDKNRRRVYYSSYGDHIDLIAPGDFVPALTTNPEEKYWAYSGGTSLATAQVSAAAAILLSINPDFTRRDLKLFLYAGTDDELGDETDTPGWDKYHGWGHLNLYNSVVLAMMPAEIREIEGGHGALRWKVPTRRRAEVGYQIEVSYDLETWYTIENAKIRFEGEDAYWHYRDADSSSATPTPKKAFYRIRPTFSQALLDAAAL